jgi:hypothetical protein
MKMKPSYASISMMLLALSLSSAPLELTARALSPSTAADSAANSAANLAACKPALHIKRDAKDSLRSPDLDQESQDQANDEAEDRILFLLRPLNDSSACEEPQQHPEALTERGEDKSIEKLVAQTRAAKARDRAAVRSLRLSKT